MQENAETLREQVRKILDDLPAITDSQEQHRLSSHAFEIAQQAEAIERLKNSREQAKIQGLVEHLYAERDHSQREATRRLLIVEEKMYGFRQERVDSLHRLLVECEAHLVKITTHKGRIKSTLSDELLLENLLEVRQLLKSLLHEQLGVSEG
jgi:hypothetical protein